MKTAIDGGGVAGSVAAILLLRQGVEVDWRLRDRSGVSLHECLGALALSALDELRLLEVVAQARPLHCTEFLVAWDHSLPTRRRGAWWCVDRTLLAQALRSEAFRLGARVVNVLPRGVWLIDATGRAARHSRPVGHAGHALASLFRAPGRRDAPRIVRTDDDSWAYAVPHPDGTTIGLVDNRGIPRHHLPAKARAELGLRPNEPIEQVRFVRVAPQWSAEPVVEQRVSAGDAACSLNPLAGTGVRSSLTTAVSAVSVVVATPEERASRMSHHAKLVADLARRHLASLSAWGVGTNRPKETLVESD